MEDDPQVVAPAYNAHGIRLYCADVRWLVWPDDVQPTVMITDPPYAMNKYLRGVEETQKLDPQRDMYWSGEIFNWVGQWFQKLREKLGPQGVAWIFVNVHYMGCYLRWGYYSKFSLRGIFPCPPDEYLLAFGPEMIEPVHVANIRALTQTNTYGQNKPLPFLRALMQASPPGIVLDPFAGLGSTLDAAQLEGREAMGVEIIPAFVEQTVARWQNQLLKHT